MVIEADVVGELEDVFIMKTKNEKIFQVKKELANQKQLVDYREAIVKWQKGRPRARNWKQLREPIFSHGYVNAPWNVPSGEFEKWTFQDDKLESESVDRNWHTSIGLEPVTVYFDKCKAIEEATGRPSNLQCIRLAGKFIGDYLERMGTKKSTNTEDDDIAATSVEMDYMSRLWGTYNWWQTALEVIRRAIDQRISTKPIRSNDIDVYYQRYPKAPTRNPQYAYKVGMSHQEGEGRKVVKFNYDGERLNYKKQPESAKQAKNQGGSVGESRKRKATSDPNVTYITLVPDILVYPNDAITTNYSRNNDDFELDPGKALPVAYLAATHNALAIEIKSMHVKRTSLDISTVLNQYQSAFFTGTLLIVWIVRPGHVYTGTFEFGG